MPIQYQPKKAVRVILPNGSIGTVSEEQALRCRYQLADFEEAEKKTPSRRTRKPAEKPAETPVEAPESTE
jgi:hypothetical protein